MKDFAQLIRKVDETNKTTAKIKALAEYFQQASDRDKLWAIALLSHRRPKRPVNTTLLRQWASELAGIDLWLFEESYYIVGDLAETIALLIKQESTSNSKSLTDYISLIIQLKELEDDAKKPIIQSCWQELDFYGRFVFNKLITGGFRIGISQKLMTKALSKATGIDDKILAHRIMGNWDPATDSFEDLILSPSENSNASLPYPFYLAYAIEDDIQNIGPPEDWTAEWKWDGIRGQLIKRQGDIFLWSRGEELVTEKYPEIEALVSFLPDGIVLDGEILAYKDNLPLDFQAMQKRIGRKSVGAKLLNDIPVIFMAYDILEHNGEDIRNSSFTKRRKVLETIVPKLNHSSLMLSPTIAFESWEALAKTRSTSRTRKVEGIMLKKKDSSYKQGRVKGDMWKWKIEPYTIDAVLTYATRGHGRRANLYTDYTFGLWEDGQLVTFAKAYSGLTDKEFQEVDRYVRQHTLERFGPVRMVEPKLVFELAFEGLANSKRHKSGVATRFPRIKRWRKDKTAEDANTLDDLKSML
ncbi:MAG: ATP-dependent DNA ligase [Saprospiraceae bacterium]|nr:ATP-dependent DNA ligase [Saprospiraceae bacterium]